MEQPLGVGQSISTQSIWNRHISQSIVLDDSVIVINVAEGFSEQDFVVTLGNRDNTVLTYPYAAPTLTFTIRNPDFGNSNAVRIESVNVETQHGILKQLRDSDWPTIETLTMSFSALNKQDADDFIDFVNQSLGQEIGLLDLKNRQWRGVITTPAQDIVQSMRNRGFSLGFTFEGELV